MVLSSLNVFYLFIYLLLSKNNSYWHSGTSNKDGEKNYHCAICLIIYNR